MIVRKAFNLNKHFFCVSYSLALFYFWFVFIYRGSFVTFRTPVYAFMIIYYFINYRLI